MAQKTLNFKYGDILDGGGISLMVLMPLPYGYITTANFKNSKNTGVSNVIYLTNDEIMEKKFVSRKGSSEGNVHKFKSSED